MKTPAQLRENLAERYWNKRKMGVPVDVRKASPQTDIDSGLAEKCVCDFLGCEFNDEVFDSNDGGYDCIYNEKKIDAKWLGKKDGIPRTSGRIIVDIHKLGIADIYVAVSGSEEKGFYCVGWCTREDLLNQPIWLSNYPDRNGNYERYAIRTELLRKMKELKI